MCAQVYYKCTDLLDDQVLLSGLAVGALTQVPQREWRSASLATLLAQEQGLFGLKPEARALDHTCCHTEQALDRVLVAFCEHPLGKLGLWHPRAIAWILLQFLQPSYSHNQDKGFSWTHLCILPSMCMVYSQACDVTCSSGHAAGRSQPAHACQAHVFRPQSPESLNPSCRVCTHTR